ncbi:MAG TPA: PLxRFG domain-containing protein [Gammaproteobacteria bacterium]|nr:PLxRFG domain-containing protein [Gammaproteobacteria bacterium]
MNLAEFRQRYPQYDDMSDEQLASRLHQRFYADMPYEAFRQAVGIQAAPTDGVAEVSTPDAGRSVAEAMRSVLPSGLRAPVDAAPSAPQALNLPPVMVAPGEIANRAEFGNPKEGLTPGGRLPMGVGPTVMLKDYSTDGLSPDELRAVLRQRQMDETAGVPGPIMKPAPEPTPLTPILDAVTFRGNGEKTPEAMARADVYAIDASTARERGESLKAYRERTGPRTGPLERLGKDVASGALSTGEGMVGYLARLADGDPRIRGAAADIGGKAADLLPADPNFLDSLAAGFGSTAAFFVPGAGIARGAEALARTAQRMALWLGSGAAAGMEAAAEAGSVYEQLLREGRSPDEAARIADRVFWANTALVTLTDRYGLFGEQGGQLMRRALGAVNEGVLQEAPQQGISNLATGRPLTEGMGESAAVGSIVGAGLAGNVPSAPAERGRDASAADVAERIRSLPGDVSRETVAPAPVAAPAFSRKLPENGYTPEHGQQENPNDQGRQHPADTGGMAGDHRPDERGIPPDAGLPGGDPKSGDGGRGPDAAAAAEDYGRGVPGSAGEIQVDDLDSTAFVAGLSPQELDNPNIVALARQEWQIRRWNSPFFRKWFGDGAFREPDGSPMIMYHGTPNVFESFDRNRIGASGHAASGLGFFFTSNRDQAEHYRDGGQIMKLVTNIRNPYRMSLGEFASFETVDQAKARAAELRARGYDGIYVETPKVQGEQPQTYVIAFDPNQIKSVDNRGTFSSGQDNIFHSRGSTVGPPGQADTTGAAPRTTPRSPASAGLSVSEAREAIAPVVLRWGSNAPRIEVVADEAALPERIRAEATRDPNAAPINGAYDPGSRTIYLLSSRLASREQALRTLAHEAVGHYGIEAILGDQFHDVLRRVQWLRANGDRTVVRIANVVDRLYGNVDEQTRSREIIARMAEEGVKHPLMVRLVAALKNFLRRLGFTMKFSTTELRAMIARAARHLDKDRPTEPPESPASMFSRDGRHTDVQVPERTSRWMGFERPVRLFADFAALQRRHAEYYRSADEVRKDVEYVLAKPDDWYPHADGRVTIFRQGREGIPSLRIDFRVEQQGRGGYRIVSVYPMTRRSIAGKMKEKGRGLGRDGRISERIVSSKKPGYLTIAEYLDEVQGNGSWAPASPSGEAHQAPSGNIGDGTGTRKDTGDVSRETSPGSDARQRDDSGSDEPLMSRDPQEVLSTIDEAIQETALDRVSGVISRTRVGSYKLMTRQMLADVGKGVLPQITTYVKFANRMDADRNALMNEAGELANRWTKFMKADRQAADRLASLMHESTIAGVDPSEEYVPLIEKREARERIKVLRQQARTRSAEADRFIAQIKETETLMAQEVNRKRAWPELRRKYEALPDEARALYQAVRDLYTARFEATHEALQARIERAELSASEKRALKEKLRKHFEAVRVQGPYFPLARFGDFWVSGKKGEGDGAETVFYMVESPRQQKRVAASLRRDGYRVSTGKKLENIKALQGASAGFVADVIDIVEKTGGSGTIANQVKDEIYQLYLTTLPDLSVRKHFLHRKKTKGYSHDALRAYARDMFHGAHQLARLRYSDRLEALLENMRESIPESADPNKAADVLNELQKRHEWMMNPKGGWLANTATSIGFVFYLGLTPAAALVNTLQTPMVALPVIGAKFGYAKTADALARAGRDYFAGGFDIENSLSGEERQAYQQLVDMGVIEKTLAHDLAGLSETPSAIYSTNSAKAMAIVSFLFHQAEVFNRQVTAMATYRLARAKGMGMAEAIDMARELTLESHFDYSNANRAPFMQGDVPKMLFLFKQYSLNMTWLLARNLQLATDRPRAALRNGAAWLLRIDALRRTVKVDAETRRLARRKLAGILGMTALFAGVNGLPLLWLVKKVLEALFDDEDDPWEFETEFRNFLADHLGQTGANMVYNGPVEGLTGVGISNRVSLNELWFRSPDRDLEGKGWAGYWLEQTAGPLAAMFINTARGYDLIRKGHTYRGIEAMMPKVVKDNMKAFRYAGEGVQNLRGDEIVADLTGLEVGMQALGFTPSRVTRRYDANSALYKYKDRIERRRQLLINRWALAKRVGDHDAVREALTAIRKFNRKNRRYLIDVDTLIRSMRNRRHRSFESRNGVYLSPRNRHLRGRIRFGD